MSTFASPDLPAIPDMFPEVQPHRGVEDDNQRFTTREAMAWVLATARLTAFDLDVAACAESSKALRYYDAKQNGLVLPWFKAVFCNPPWDDIGPWVRRAWDAVMEPFGQYNAASTVAMLLPGNRTHRDWWQCDVEPFRDGRSRLPYSTYDLGMQDPRFAPGAATLDVYFAPKRFSYGGPGNPLGIGVAEPNFTSVLLLFRGHQ